MKGAGCGDEHFSTFLTLSSIPHLEKKNKQLRRDEGYGLLEADRPEFKIKNFISISELHGGED